RCVATLEQHLAAALAQAGRVILITHHPACYDLGFPHVGAPMVLDSYLWDAFCGNRAMEELVARHADRIAFVFCGHTHRARQSTRDAVRGYNVGGDYHFKR